MLINRLLWLKVHRWSGLLLGFLFVIAGLSGSALTFREPLDRWLNTPSTLMESSTRLSPSELIAHVEQALPAYWAERLRLDYKPGSLVLVRVIPKDTNIKPTVDEVWVTTSTGQVVSRRLSSDFKLDKQHLVPLIFRLHYSLFLESVGQVCLGILSLIWVFSIFAGVRLAWPKRNYLKAFTIKLSASRIRVLFDIHRALGLVTAPILLIICLTGIYLTTTSWVLPIIQAFSATTLWPPSFTSSPKSLIQAQSPETSIQIAKKLFPDGTPIRLVIDPLCSFHRVDLLRPSDAGETPETVVFVDMYAGTVMSQVSVEKYTTGDKFIAWIYPLHTGEFLHIQGRILWLFIGLSPLVLMVSGVLLYLRKRFPFLTTTKANS